VRIDKVVAELQRHWQPAFEEQRRAIRVTGVWGVRVFATEVALQQILATLIEHSLRYGGGTVHIDVRPSGPSIVVEVSDEGDGILPEEAPFVFERGASRSGTGIGLPLARDLAERYGGRLELVRATPVLFALFLSAYDAE